MQLSEHFTLAEFTHSQTAARLGLDNTPSREVTENLKLAACRMEIVRKLLGNVPIVVSSGYRSPQVNRAIGGSNTSDHCKGHAIDFVAPSFGTPFQVAKAIAEATPRIEFDQLILEFGNWVHISFAPANRRQVMTFQHGDYSNGLKP